MVQKNEDWQWLLEGFKFELEAQVRPNTVESGISEIVGVFTAPIIVFSGGWGTDLLDSLIGNG